MKNTAATNDINNFENVTHPAQGETVFLGGNFLFRISEYTQRERICSFRKLQIFISQTTDSYFANYRFSFPKLQIFISQTTDSHFANYRFSFRKLQISISQTTDFHFVSSHFVSQTTVSFTRLQTRRCTSPPYCPPRMLFRTFFQMSWR